MGEVSPGRTAKYQEEVPPRKPQRKSYAGIDRSFFFIRSTREKKKKHDPRRGSKEGEGKKPMSIPATQKERGSFVRTWDWWARLSRRPSKKKKSRRLNRASTRRLEKNAETAYYPRSNHRLQKKSG